MSSSGFLNKSTLRGNCKMLKEVSKTPKMSPEDLQHAITTVDVKVYASKSEREECVSKNPLLSKTALRET